MKLSKTSNKNKKTGGDKVEHYFTDNPPKKHDRRAILFRFLGIELELISDNGVFSKDHVDYGTKLLIQSAHEMLLDGSLLDLGCGYGVIGLTLKKLHENLSVTGVDINSYAVELAQENAKINHLDVNFIHQDGIEGLSKFDTILLNPPIRAGKKNIYRLFKEASEHITKEGQLLIVMRKQHGATSAMEYLKDFFSEVKRLKRDKGYWIIQCINN